MSFPSIPPASGTPLAYAEAPIAEIALPIRTRAENLIHAVRDFKWDLANSLLEGLSEDGIHLLIQELSTMNEAIAPDRHGNIPLHKAVTCTKGKIVDLLLKAHPASLDIKTTNGGRTPLYTAARNNLTDIARIILRAGPSSEALKESLEVALQYKQNEVAHLIQKFIQIGPLACGLVAARTDTAPSSLRTFVCSRIYEPRVMRMVLQYL